MVISTSTVIGSASLGVATAAEVEAVAGRKGLFVVPCGMTVADGDDV